MDAREMRQLLTAASAIDHRDLRGMGGSAQIEAWLQAIGDLGLEECTEALGIHRATSTAYLVPAHIAQLVHDVVRPEQAWMQEQLEKRERDVAMVEAMGGTREQWDAASALGLGAEQVLLERLQRDARRRAVES